MISEETCEKKIDVECIKFIYNEAIESYRVQESSINLLNTKFNWLMAAEVAFAGFTINKIPDKSSLSTVALTFLLIALVISIISLWTLAYARGPKLSEMLGAKSWRLENLISKTSEKISHNIEINNQTLTKLSLQLKADIAFFLAGIILLSVKLF